MPVDIVPCQVKEKFGTLRFCYVSDKEYVAQWSAREYEKITVQRRCAGKRYKEELKDRPKSEVIIAEALSDAKMAIMME